MFDAIDWKLVSFVGYTLFHEYIVYMRYPQVHYWDLRKGK
ncbi:hypothetical protein J2S19_003651 [Metabacillus malikii]|uniref:Uncharacterized protein n=1 Tax=Metabacillus malikii TaxID=1504265 RepID=A0ABT9ZKM9_9BACI|nr:hypothetical protein [Metabacillus malikii]